MTIQKLAFILILIAFVGMAAAAGQLRQDINRDWKFKPGDYPGGEAAAFDDVKWDAINLPHSFSLHYFQSKDFYTGYGWYRKHLEIKPEWALKRIFVEFEGAFQDAEIYVNGTRIGEHKGGFATNKPEKHVNSPRGCKHLCKIVMNQSGIFETAGFFAS
jgi:beta-galactosidase/beta-glucuronidase